jgi:putative tricarboxylic transport membrane protein
VKTQRSADIWSGAFLAVLGLVVLGAAWKITGGLEERLPPRTLPYTMGVTILVSGMLLVIRAWRYSGENLPIHWPDRAGAIRILVIIASLAVYIAIIDPLGMPVSTALYLAFQVWYLSRGRYRVLSALLTGVISGVVVYYLFIQFLELSFPVGILQR